MLWIPILMLYIRWPSKQVATPWAAGQSDGCSVPYPRGTTEGVKLPTSCRSVPIPSEMFQASYGTYPHPAAWFPFPPLLHIFWPPFTLFNPPQELLITQDLTANRQPKPVRLPVQRIAKKKKKKKVQDEMDKSDQKQHEEPEVVSLLDNLLNEDKALQFTSLSQRSTKLETLTLTHP